MAPASLPPASSVLATLSLPSNRLAAARLAPERGGAPVAAQPEIDHYRILRTDEVDATDAPLTAEERASIIATAAAAIRSTGDDFAGTAHGGEVVYCGCACGELRDRRCGYRDTSSEGRYGESRPADQRRPRIRTRRRGRAQCAPIGVSLCGEPRKRQRLPLDRRPESARARGSVHDDGSLGPSAGERRHLRQAEVRTRLVPRLLRRQDAGGDLRLLRSAYSDTGGGVAVLRYEPCAWAKPRPADTASTHAGDLGGAPDFRH